tara:strand:+ start:4957 stop:5343 length:387 start_codon:yes stop_codon:yes gene_type:complete
MNIDLKEVRKMVTTTLIQERVGYYGSGVEGDAGEPSDAPAIDEMVDEAKDQMDNLEMSKTNVAQAAVADSTERLVGPLVQAGVDPKDIKEMLNDLYVKVMDKIRLSNEEDEKVAAAAKIDISAAAAGE